ncbi:hypothetical protein SLEP1_g689 [Rubroshorea leprosula]|uniref:F-box domain-containing protein n=1 Tax=Rubroshorea leprosula TaxID=152421 RepID=A0AAV5HKS6_9ROSI|nr:hypothetical protein SLEP1_g689 [Rubroshorea leprosula]
MSSKSCGSSLLIALPDDVFSIISRSLSPRDVCSLSLCCKILYELVSSEKIWFTQCDMIGVLTGRDLVEWRQGVSSYKALCRFLLSLAPLIGIWVHQNPELGNVVYVMPGFVSVVGCRVIPQELGPLGIEDGPILWAPVFEIIGDFDGSTIFFLHGRDKGYDCLYPGLLKSVDRDCNVLWLEVEPGQQRNGCESLHSESSEHYSDKEISRRFCRSSGELSRSDQVSEQSETVVPFSRLAFSDRRMLLEKVTGQVCLQVPDSASGPLFPRLRDDVQNFQKDILLLSERRSLLLKMCEFSVDCNDIGKADCEMPANSTQLKLREFRMNLDCSTGCYHPLNGDDSHTQISKRKTIGGYIRGSLKQILGWSSSNNSSHATRSIFKSSSSNGEKRYAQLNEFLKTAYTIGLTLRASRMKLSSYRGWPNMPETRFALYKLPILVPKADQEYAGLWGGTFGWPPGKPSEDKPGKALFFLLLSYEESEGQRLLIATKILEGTHYVLHPNGSPMFIVNIDEPAQEQFPWNIDANSNPVNIKHAFVGEGIANGYGFRYPGAKPGSLFVIQNGILAFIWKETKSVLTLQRINLQELLKKGERVPPLPPVANFSYLTKSYSNVYAGFSNTSTCFTSPRMADT